MRRDDGLALVEFAILAPFLGLMVMGVLEAGTAWRDALSVQDSVRAGARTAANAGDHTHSDFETVRAIEIAMANDTNVAIQRVVIYNADASPDVPAACQAGASVAGLCNVYDFPHGMVDTDFNAVSVCTTSPARQWCPTTRDNDLVGGLGRVGVHVQAERDWVTNLIPSPAMTIERSIVMQFDPET